MNPLLGLAMGAGAGALGEKGGRIIRTNLDTSKEAALREASGKAHSQAIAERHDAGV